MSGPDSLLSLCEDPRDNAPWVCGVCDACLARDQWDKDRAEIEELREYRDKNEAIGCETCYPFRHPEAARKPHLNPTGDR